MRISRLLAGFFNMFFCFLRKRQETKEPSPCIFVSNKNSRTDFLLGFGPVNQLGARIDCRCGIGFPDIFTGGMERIFVYRNIVFLKGHWLRVIGAVARCGICFLLGFLKILFQSNHLPVIVLPACLFSSLATWRITAK